MKKLFTLILGIAFVYSCSTSSDGNGNSTTTVIPVAPSNLTGTAVSATQINLSWTDNSTNETGFKIERKTGTGTFVVIGTTTTDVTTFNDSGLLPGTSYIYRVYSFNITGNSPSYSNEFTISTQNLTAINVPGPNITDIDGNIYNTVTICNQNWMKTNLNVSKYRNGDVIPQVTDPTAWAALTTGAWCYYANNANNGTTYGKLYNWYAINDPRGLAPSGYHIPSDIEWNSLVLCLGNLNVAGGAMKEIGTIRWITPNTGATNSSGFTGLPGGSRMGSPYLFNYIGGYGYWWTSSVSSSNVPFYRTLSHISAGIGGRYSGDKTDGLSIRCVKD